MTDFSAPQVHQIWQQACAMLQEQVSKAAFQTWILHNPLTAITQLEEGKVKAVISCPTAFHATTLKRNFQEYLQNVLMVVIEQEVELEYIVDTPGINKRVNNGLPAVPTYSAPTPVAAPETPQPTPAVDTPQNITPPPAGHVANTLASHPLFTGDRASFGATARQSSGPAPESEDLRSHALSSQTHRPKHVAPLSPRAEELFSDSTIQSVAVDRAAVRSRQIGLRGDYTFETFAVSTTNEMAHAAATAVSNRPGGAYNPLFLYGGVGVGKTHLMHAIANNILKNNPEARILYSTGEEFTNEIVSAIQTKKALRFKEKHRSVDVMLIDDVQFIAGKNAVQEEFFHTFNSLIKNQAQLVLTSDRPPHEINLLEDRLRSRFEAGLMIDIQQPSFELRTAILLIKANAHGVAMPMDVAQLIASKVHSARKIEGLVTTLKSEVELKKRDVSIELVEEILRLDSSHVRPQLKVQPYDIIRAVANHYHIKQIAIRGTKRTQDIVHARHVAMYLFKEELKLSLTEIGNWFSNRDHTSALHAVRKIEASLQRDELLQRDISALRMSLAAVSR